MNEFVPEKEYEKKQLAKRRAVLSAMGALGLGATTFSLFSCEEEGTEAASTPSSIAYVSMSSSEETSIEQ